MCFCSIACRPPLPLAGPGGGAKAEQWTMAWYIQLILCSPAVALLVVTCLCYRLPCPSWVWLLDPAPSVPPLPLCVFSEPGPGLCGPSLSLPHTDTDKAAMQADKRE